MKPEEAISILQVRIQSRPLIGKHEVYGAIQLGIEALKRDQHNRLVNNHPDQALLPGETKD